LGWDDRRGNGGGDDDDDVCIGSTSLDRVEDGVVDRVVNYAA
jgi:hypothetical protein